jgi:predicted RNA polymerase sigma factor
VALARGPRAGLQVVDEVEDRLGATHRFFAVRGQLLEMAGEGEAAADLLERAAALATNDAERRHLLGRAARLRATAAE